LTDKPILLRIACFANLYMKGFQMSKLKHKNEKELKALQATANTTLYRRVQLAHEALSDVEWLSQWDHERDARKYLSENYFVEVSGTVSLASLVSLYTTCDEKAWKKVNYNPLALIDLQKEAQKEDRKPQRRATLAELEEQKEEIERLQKLVEELQAKLQSSEAECQSLRSENARLEGRCEELREQIAKKEAA